MGGGIGREAVLGGTTVATGQWSSFKTAFNLKKMRQYFLNWENISLTLSLLKFPGLIKPL